MKCPKCKYNTFEFLDSCKKCGADLRPFKESLGIRAVILPARRESPPAVIGSSTLDNPPAFAAAGKPDGNTEDAFSWDTPTSPSPDTDGASPAVALAPPADSSEESFTFASSEGLSFGDLPGFSENPAEESREKSAKRSSPNEGEFAEFAFEDFSQDESVVSPPQSSALHESDAFSPGEFDFLLENDPPADGEGRRG